MWMKNERRYRGIIRAQMKDLGVFLPKGFGDEEGRCEGVKKRKKQKKRKPHYKNRLHYASYFCPFCGLSLIIISVPSSAA